MIRKAMLASLFLAVVSAGAVTVKQLSTAPKFLDACGQHCTVAQPACPAPICFCDIPPGSLVGTCKLRPI